MKDEKTTLENHEIPLPDEPEATGSAFDTWAPVLAPDDPPDDAVGPLGDSKQLPLF